MKGVKDKQFYFKFDDIEQIKSIYKILVNRKVFNCLDEIDEEHHKNIDKIVFDYLELSEEMREYVIETLKLTVLDRTKKSKQKA